MGQLADVGRQRACGELIRDIGMEKVRIRQIFLVLHIINSVGSASAQFKHIPSLMGHMNAHSKVRTRVLLTAHNRFARALRNVLIQPERKYDEVLGIQ